MALATVRLENSSLYQGLIENFYLISNIVKMANKGRLKKSYFKIWP